MRGACTCPPSLPRSATPRHAPPRPGASCILSRSLPHLSPREQPWPVNQTCRLKLGKSDVVRDATVRPWRRLLHAGCIAAGCLTRGLQHAQRSALLLFHFNLTCSVDFAYSLPDVESTREVADGIASRSALHGGAAQSRSSPARSLTTPRPATPRPATPRHAAPRPAAGRVTFLRQKAARRRRWVARCSYYLA